VFSPNARAAVMAASSRTAPRPPLLDEYGCRVIAPRPPSSDRQTVVGGGLTKTVDREFQARNTHSQDSDTQQTGQQDSERQDVHHCYTQSLYEPHSVRASTQPAFSNRAANELSPLINPDFPSKQLPPLGDVIHDVSSSATAQTRETRHALHDRFHDGSTHQWQSGPALSD
jgi:hypothetical protein